MWTTDAHDVVVDSGGGATVGGGGGSVVTGMAVRGAVSGADVVLLTVVGGAALGVAPARLVACAVDTVSATADCAEAVSVPSCARGSS